MYDLARLTSFIAEKNSTAAKRAGKAVRDAVQTLRPYPEIGRVYTKEKPQRREWIVPFGKSAYIVLYEYDGRLLTILSIRYGREESF